MEKEPLARGEEDQERWSNGWESAEENIPREKRARMREAAEA